MQLGSAPIVETSSVLAHYREHNLATDMIEKCNSMEFKYIDGAGEGFFLTLNTTDASAQTVTFQVTDTITASVFSATVYILDKISLEHPDHPGPHLSLIHVAEQKYYFKQIVVIENYNVIHRRKVTASGGEFLPPHETPLTLKQIIENFTGKSVDYDGNDIYPMDVFIEGMDALSAIDLLCATYGLLWSYNGTIYIYYPATLISSSSPILTPTIPIDPLNDIRASEADNPFNSITVTFPLLETCLRHPHSFHSDAWSTSGAGRALNIYHRFFPAVFLDDTLENEPGIDANAALLRDNMQAIGSFEGNYAVKHIYAVHSIVSPPRFLSFKFADFGKGPRTIYDSKSYPYQLPPQAPTLDRQAKHWIGYLAASYNEINPWLLVEPQIGLDGLKPTGTQTVYNTYSWDNGRVGALIRVEWSCEQYRWLALQQEYECPEEDEEPIPPEEPPPEYEGYPEWPYPGYLE